jgi:hypothetical protein
VPRHKIPGGLYRPMCEYAVSPKNMTSPTTKTVKRNYSWAAYHHLETFGYHQNSVPIEDFSWIR